MKKYDVAKTRSSWAYYTLGELSLEESDHHECLPRGEIVILLREVRSGSRIHQIVLSSRGMILIPGIPFSSVGSVLE